jgi:uncharacterized SAM-binding protein YcdF (DUF218 family)
MTRADGLRGARLVRRALACGVILAVLAWAAAAAGRLLVVASSLPDPDAVLVLGSHEWERIPAAAEFAGGFPAARVLLTEPVHPTPENCHLCGQRVSWLARLGIDQARVVVLPRRVTSTYDEAVSALNYCREQSIVRLVIVTSPYHTRRTLATFATVFRGSGTALAVQPVPDARARPDRWWRDPYDRAYVRYEWAALAWYVLRHRVNPFAAPPEAAFSRSTSAAIQRSSAA